MLSIDGIFFYTTIPVRCPLTPNATRRANHRFAVKPLTKKYSDLQKLKISCISISSCPVRGALAIVTDVGQDAVDAEGAEDGRHLRRTAKSCGPDASAVGVKLGGAICLATVSTKPDHRGEHEVSRKPSCGECWVFPVYSW